VYATVPDVRAEGVTGAMASSRRLLSLLDEASRTIDLLTGWFFEPRELTLRLDGRGTPTLELPVPPIRIERLAIDGTELYLDGNIAVVVGSPVGPGFDGPRITLRHGLVFPKGAGNVEVEGLFGYTEPDGTPTGRTPLQIKRACLLLVLRWLHPLSGDASADARNRWRVIEERTRDQSYKLGALPATAPITSDPEVDAIIWRYARPPGLGAV
jgi:hypothetical protein